jgi:hypothetical protein
MSALKPIEWYETAWGTVKKSATSCPTDPAALNRSHMEQFVYAVRARGVRPVTCNTWLRALNAFCRWLHEKCADSRSHPAAEGGEAACGNVRRRGHPHPRHPQAADLDQRQQKHVNGHPRRVQKAFALWRVHSLTCALLDTGCRIDELLTALTTSFEQDDLLLTVIGKVTSSGGCRSQWSCGGCCFVTWKPASGWASPIRCVPVRRWSSVEPAQCTT